MSESVYDLIVVGAGAMGTAHAIEAAGRGLKVLIIEKDRQPSGASVLSHGALTPISFKPGHDYDRALMSRDKWLEMSEIAGYWSVECGSVHIAESEESMQVLREYHTRFGFKTRLLTKDMLRKIAPGVISSSVIGGLYSDMEAQINPSKAMYALHHWLKLQPGCEIHFSEQVIGIEKGLVQTNRAEYKTNATVACMGVGATAIYPDLMDSAGLNVYTFQMVRTEPLRKGAMPQPVIFDTLSLARNAGLEQCDSYAQFSATKGANLRKYEDEGIALVITRNRKGQMILGSSCVESGSSATKVRHMVTSALLKRLKTLFSIGSRVKPEVIWSGEYLAFNGKEKKPIMPPCDGVKIVGGYGTSSLSLSFGVARETLESL